MADDEDMEEAPTANPSEIPDLAGQTSSLIVPPSMESSMTSRTQSASLTGTATSNPEDPSGAIIKRISQTSGSTVQNGSRVQVPLDEAARSKEELRKSQELHLNGKKPSLDQLGKDKPQQSLKTRPARLHRQCQRRFREIIGKRELKNEELEKQEGDLRQRLNILECSMPAVMVWNIWRMTQCGSGPSLQRVLEKQFQGPASGEVYCPTTPSRHFDCRVREVEAERKQAQKRVEEAKTLWAEKLATLEEREKKLEEAKKVQEEQKVRIQQLTAEAKKLKDAASVVEDDGSCETGECAVIECKKKWLEKVPSSASIKSTDLECLDKLQQLAETELCMKRQIADLERREEAYMRTLQQADEMWLKIESDAASTMSAMQEQLDAKTAANQQLQDELELLRARMATCRTELEKYMSIGKIEALIGRDDDFAEVTDRGSAVGVRMKYRMAGREDDFADVEDKDSLMRGEMSEKDMMARPDLSEVGIGVEPIVSDMTMMAKDEMADKDSLARPDWAEAGFGVHPDVSDLTTGVGPDDFTLEERRLDEARAYLARLGSLSALEGHEDYICPPDFACNDLVFSETGLTEEELTALKEGRVTAEMLLGQAAGVPVEATPGVMMRTAQFGASVEESVLQEFETRTPGEDMPIEEMGLGEDIRSTEVGHPDLREDMADAVVFYEKLGREDLIATEIQTESRPPVSELYENNILVSRVEMLKWQQDIDLIRVTIAVLL
ncbi:uncharacterized protein LOC143377064 [Andrena cerasifolii]|uniref:uncharacterized protein LOC143377064 n=1 Tax=Andrena cerasifolii TaxID=2819439 RepID=UPI0040377397